MRNIFLIDGSGLAYRAFFAFSSRPLMTSRGEVTTAIYGFLRTLLKILREYPVESLYVAFDSPREQVVRRKAFTEYKAQRQKAPDELKVQFQAIKEFLQKAQIPVLTIPGYEADDVIATLAKTAETQGKEVYIVTGDKDMLQLVNDKIKVLMYNPQQSELELFDRQKVIEKWGVPPEKLIDLLALMGDAVDNIPGVQGIGKKTAQELLSKYQSLEEIYEKISFLPTTLQEKLLKEKENAFLSKELVKLETNVPVEIQEFKPFNPEQLKSPQVIEFLKYYEMKSIIAELTGIGVKYSKKRDITEETPSLFSQPSLFEQPQETPTQTSPEPSLFFTMEETPPTSTTISTTIISSTELLESFKKEILNVEHIIIDYVLVSKYFATYPKTSEDQKPVDSTLPILAIKPLKSDKLYIIPIEHANNPLKNLTETVLVSLKPILENEKQRKYGHNLKPLKTYLKFLNIEMKGIHRDIALMSYLLNPTSKHSLESLTQNFLTRNLKTWEDLQKEGINPKYTALENLSNIFVERIEAIEKLLDILEEELKKKGKLLEVLEKIDIPAIDPVSEMEYNGVKIDVDYLKKLSIDVEKEITKLIEKIYNIVGFPFNLNSPKQLSQVLFEYLKLPPVKETKTGYSTDEEVLKALESEHEVVKYILQYRTLSKLKSTYIDELPKLVSERTGRVHTIYNLTGTATGRLSSSDPNLQNIPIRDELGKIIRKAFISEKGYKIASFDYSQIELRVLAHMSGDENLKKAFEEGIDIHKKTASIIFNISEKEIDENKRRIGKTINFAVVYGMSYKGLADELKISITEAKAFINNYFEKYPKVADYIQRVLNFVSRNGYVETLFGRIRPFPELRGKASFKIGSLTQPERMAVNTTIQGTAADIMRIAMKNVLDKLKEKSLKAKMLMQIHDELVFEIPEEEIEETVMVIKEAMEKAVELSVPLVVEYGVSDNWADAKT